MTTEEHLKIFAATFYQCLQNCVLEGFDFEKEIVKFFSDKEFQEGFDSEQLARDAFLIWMKEYHDHFLSLEDAVRITKQIINCKQ